MADIGLLEPSNGVNPLIAPETSVNPNTTPDNSLSGVAISGGCNQPINDSSYNATPLITDSPTTMALEPSLGCNNNNNNMLRDIIIGVVIALIVFINRK